MTLKEEGQMAKLNKVIISGVPQHTILLNFQKYSHLHIGEKLMEIIRNDNRGVSKCCDYLMISADNNELFLIYIELKSKKVELSEVVKQLKGGTCFNAFCDKVLECFHNLPSQKTFSPNVRYILLSWASLGKEPLTKKVNRYRRKITPDEPFRRKVSNASVIPYRWLITGI